MKKIKGTIIFCFIFLIIIFINFLFYKNIDIFLPTYEKEIYSFENNFVKEQKEFLFEMQEQIEKQNNYKKISAEEIKDINENKILYNIMQNIFKEAKDNENDKIENILYTDKLSNTIYGDFKIIGSLYTDTLLKCTNFVILYSEDKIYYLDLNEEILSGTENNSNIYKESEIREDIPNIINTEESIENTANKTELINNCKKAVSEMIKENEFEPNSIIYKRNYYILRDTIKDITVYYNNNTDVIFGLYIGFEK